MPETPLVKICGLRRREDVTVADEAGADFVGVVLTEGFSRTVTVDDAPSLVAGVRARRVAVLVDESEDAAVRRGEAIEADVLQLHGDEPPALIESLARRGTWRLWKAVRARSLEDVTQAVDAYGDLVDGFLLEGWKQGVYGGAGVRLDLDGPSVRERLPASKTLVLAGGLTPDNVAQAVARFVPDVVDVSSGVESEPGQKAPDLVRGFVEAARSRTTPSSVHSSDETEK